MFTSFGALMIMFKGPRGSRAALAGRHRGSRGRRRHGGAALQEKLHGHRRARVEGLARPLASRDDSAVDTIVCVERLYILFGSSIAE